jgi:hypothetical protein
VALSFRFPGAASLIDRFPLLNNDFARHERPF